MGKNMRGNVAQEVLQDMDFQNVNPLNVRLNKLSGNLLPMTNDDTAFLAMWRIYGVLVWLLEMFQTSAIILGVASVPREKALQDSTVAFVITIEVFFLLRQIHVHRDLVNRLIGKLNNILRDADETMRIVVRSTLKPVDAPLKFYCVAGTGSIFVWCCIPVALIFEKQLFLYEDYRLPMVLSRQPFKTEIFMLGSLIALIATVYMFMKKVALDVYVINLVLLMTAQYRYIAIKLAEIFRKRIPQDRYGESENGYYSNVNFLAECEMKVLCRHHNDVVEMTLMLKKLLSLNTSLIYLINIFLFCFLDIMLINSILSTNRLEGFMVVIYICGGLVQLYIMCSCIHQLLDASTQITDAAFNEDWYQFGSSLKHIFRMMIAANNLECKLSVSEKFNLSLPSFMTILNQSYSFALLFLRMK